MKNHTLLHVQVKLDNTNNTVVHNKKLSAMGSELSVTHTNEAQQTPTITLQHKNHGNEVPTGGSDQAT